MGLDNLKEDVTSALGTLTDGIVGNPLGAVATATGIGVIGGAIGGSLVTSAVAKRKRKKRSKSKSSRKRNSSRRKKRMRRTPRTAGRGKDRSHKRIRYTKNGQPYVITSNGRAKFISKRGAKLSRKRKGGRY